MAAPVMIIQAAPQIIAAQPAPAGAAAQVAAQPTTAFSQLVNDASAALETTVTASTARAANPDATAEPDMAAMLAAMLSHEVNPAEAADILDHLEQTSSTQIDANAQGSDQQLKQQLQDIIATQIPKQVKDLLADASADTEAGALPVAEITPETLQQAGLGAAAQRVLNFISKTISKKDAANPTQELPQDTTADLGANALNPALMLLAAGPFQATPDAQKPEETTDAPSLVTEPAAGLVTTVVPVAQQVIVAAPVAESKITSEDLPATQAIDARVPSLKITDKKGSLPQVMLPGGKQATATETPSEFKGLTEQALESGQPLPQDLKQELNAQATAAAIPQTAGYGTVQAPAAVEATTVISAPNSINRAPVADQVSVAIHQANKEGIEKITVQLDPIELGRVEVNMHIGKDGQAHVTFLIDKPETFDALSRDARHLEQSLQEAGIKADTGGMQFNLRQQPQQQSPADTNGSGKQQQGSENDVPGGKGATDDKVVQLTPAQNYRINIHDGLDIRA